MVLRTNDSVSQFICFIISTLKPTKVLTPSFLSPWHANWLPQSQVGGPAGRGWIKNILERKLIEFCSIWIFCFSLFIPACDWVAGFSCYRTTEIRRRKWFTEIYKCIPYLEYRKHDVGNVSSIWSNQVNITQSLEWYSQASWQSSAELTPKNTSITFSSSGMQWTSIRTQAMSRDFFLLVLWFMLDIFCRS